ncbi:MAG: MgtC/SapB family protein [Eubacteriales bacterium]|nr:MgtC/SapB family protein [Eubacteriales bacterium]
MLKCFDFARNMGFFAITVRLVFAVLCGGLIGMEREYKRRPAGFRTHILICLGAAVTTLTAQYLYLELKLYTDVARLGAQVVAGIGFMGAGTIIVTNRQRVKGLTTAAGLWTSAIIGLVCGAGYLECAIFATAMVLAAEIFLIKLEYRFAKKKKDVNIYLEYRNANTIECVMKVLRERNIRIDGLEITKVGGENGELSYHAVMALTASAGQLDEEIAKELTSIDQIITVEEL